MAEDDRIIEALKRLEPPTLAARLRPLMPVIDEQIRAGVPHEAVCRVLAENGLEVGLATLRSNLYRYRRTQSAAGAQEGASRLAEKSGESRRAPPKLKQKPEGSTEGHRDSLREFAALLDPKTRNAEADKYVFKRRPLIRPKQG